jgi:hypothetical protein
MDVDWNAELAEQLDWQWRSQLRPRLNGLTDEEYLWEPVPHMWSVRPRGTSTAPVSLGEGGFTFDYARPEPDPPRATTIAWRLCHLLVGVFGMRVAAHFGGPPASYQGYDYPGDAATALGRLDEVYAAWLAGVRGLGTAGLARPCGPLHHGAEVALLRDLYRWRAQPGGGLSAPPPGRPG